MSEFSNSFHAHDLSGEQAAQLLCDARATGLVLPKHGKLTTMLVARRNWEAVTDKSKGLLMLYELAVDHGVSVRLFDGPKQKGHLAKSFSTGQKLFEPAPFIAAGFLTRATAAEVDQLLGGRTMDRTGRDKLVSLLGLSDAAGIGADDLAERKALLVTTYPAALFVERGVRAPWEIDLAEQSVILCALSPKRLAQLKEEPSLAADLLEARHEQTIKGLLDLGSRGGALIKAFTRSDASEIVTEAIRARSGAALDGLPEGLTARLIGATDVARIATTLDAQNESLVKDRCAAAGAALGQPKLEMGFKAMRDLYRSAARNGESMLVAFE